MSSAVAGNRTPLKVEAHRRDNSFLSVGLTC